LLKVLCYYDNTFVEYQLFTIERGTVLFGKGFSFKSGDAFRWTDIIIGLFFAISLLALGLFIAINFRPLYYLSISWMDLPGKSGYNAVVIKENYNALIDYCCPFFTGDLVFPSLPSSASAISHFAEVKTIFNTIYIAGFISLIATVTFFILRHRAGSYCYLRTCAITTVVLPVFVGIYSLIDFDSLFILFHKVFFDNDNWIFNPETDPIIDMLPESYFALCAVVIILTMFVGALVAYLFYRRRLKKFRASQTLSTPQKNYIY